MLDDFGRIAVISGAIEEMAYDPARSLGLKRHANGRMRSFAQECADIVARLNDPRLPQHIRLVSGGDWCDGISNWARRAPTVMDEHRDAVLHRAYYSRWSEEDGHEPIWNRIRATGPSRTRSRRLVSLTRFGRSWHWPLNRGTSFRPPRLRRRSEVHGRGYARGANPVDDGYRGICRASYLW